MSSVWLAEIRREYAGLPLSETESLADPFAQFAAWLAQVQQAEEPDYTAMALATASADGRPSVRTVLLKGVDARGLVFFTNYRSRKGRDLAENPRASALLFWRSLERQVRIDGAVEKVTEAESDAYFASRPLASRLSAAASHQSSVVPDRAALEAAVDALRRQYPDEQVPRPRHWGGYRIVPTEFEFWQGRLNRLHDRLQYVRTSGGWTRQRLAP